MTKTTTEKLAFIENHGYKFLDRRDFEEVASPELIKRAKQFSGRFVVYDPKDDVDGWLLVSDSVHNIINETYAMLETELTEAAYEQSPEYFDRYIAGDR